ncbi:MAG: zinc-binding dehydrogenase [Alicyclobacillus sp.]|nr:zinc-binding dehydrogenase [Alicyclobacillus sp.]
MKVASIRGVRSVELIDMPEPAAVGDKAVVKVTIAPMCTEYKRFLNGDVGHLLGHEAVGEVVDVAKSGSLKVGDRVVAMPLEGCGRCEYCLAGDYILCTQNSMVDCCMAQYVLKPSFILKKIPDDIPDELASLACCGLGPSFGAYQVMGLSAFDTVLVTGLGPVGLGAVINARFRGARVIGVDFNPFRSNLALELGAETVLDPRDPDILHIIKDLCQGGGPDCAIDCSGNVQAHRLCLDSVKRKGRVAFVGACHDETPLIVSKDLINKCLSIYGAWHYNLNDFHKILQVIRGFVQIEKLISHILPMSQIQTAFEISAGQNSAKILIKPWE